MGLSSQTPLNLLGEGAGLNGGAELPTPQWQQGFKVSSPHPTLYPQFHQFGFLPRASPLNSDHLPTRQILEQRLLRGDLPPKQDQCRISGLLTFIPDVHLLSAGGISLCPVGRWSLGREPIPLYLLPPPSALRCNPFLRSNLSLYCCRSRTSSPSIPPDIRRRDPDLEEHCSARGPPPRSGPRLRCGGSAPSAARGLARAPSSLYAGPGDLAVRQAWPSLEGWNGRGEGLASALRPRHHRRPLSLPLSPLRSDPGAIETATRCSAALKHQLREEGAAAGGGAGVEAEPGVGRGPGRRDREAGRQGGVP